MIRGILAVRDEELRSKLTAEVVALAALKYDKEKVAEYRQRIRMATTKDILMASFVGEELVEHGVQQGIEKGIEKGLDQGRAAATRRHIRQLLQWRNAGLSAQVDWLQEVTDPDKLDNLFDALLAARDESQLTAALKAFRPE